MSSVDDEETPKAPAGDTHVAGFNAEKHKLNLELKKFLERSGTQYNRIETVTVFLAIVDFLVLIGFAVAVLILRQKFSQNPNADEIVIGIFVPLITLLVIGLIVKNGYVIWQNSKVASYRMKIADCDLKYEVPAEVWRTVLLRDRTARIIHAFEVCLIQFLKFQLYAIFLLINKKNRRAWVILFVVESIFFFAAFLTWTALILIKFSSLIKSQNRTVMIWKNAVLTPGHYYEWNSKSAGEKERKTGSYQIPLKSAEVKIYSNYAIALEITCGGRRVYKIPVAPEFEAQVAAIARKF